MKKLLYFSAHMLSKKSKGKKALVPRTAGIHLLSELAEMGSGAFDEMFERLQKRAGKTSKKDVVQNISVDEATARTTLWRLEKKGLVMRRARRYEVTEEGVRIVEMLHREEKQPEWDGKWRLVMFDIPEDKRAERDWLRYQLGLVDYRPLQKSVFIGRYPLEEGVYAWLMQKRLNRCVRLLTVGDIDFDLDNAWSEI